jgi:hypothetical protein
MIQVPEPCDISWKDVYVKERRLWEIDVPHTEL